MSMRIVYIILASFLLLEFTSCFKVYWNVPTSLCHNHGFLFNDLLNKYGIIQNKNDTFFGEKISILYDFGEFPAILEVNDNHKLVIRNGGIPAEGNLTRHLLKFTRDVEQFIDDKNILSVIDFEYWRPTWDQNFGATLKIYQNLAKQIVRNRHPSWTDNEIEETAAKNWNTSSQLFILETIRRGWNLKPSTKWGFYGYPLCFNNDGQLNCSDRATNDNNNMMWLWNVSDILLPSTYLNTNLTEQKITNFVRGRIREAKRIASISARRPEVFAYFYYGYTDRNGLYLNSSVIKQVFEAIESEGGDGVILWGSSIDFKTKEDCQRFDMYLTNTLGPVVYEHIHP